MTSGTRAMTSRDGQRWSFDAGTFSIELLLTGGPGAYAVWEVLHTPDDLAAWLRDSRLADLAPLPDLRITADELARIRAFRDTLWAAAATVAHGGTPTEAQLTVLNAAAGAQPVPRIDPATLAREWVGPVTGAQVLGAAAADAIALLSSDMTGRLRECAGDNCRLLFVDTSRPGSRRWCSMQRCGNRHKVRSHRDRSAAATTQ
jgi:predicted RNA-binding Zn ribbon-like protein